MVLFNLNIIKNVEPWIWEILGVGFRKLCLISLLVQFSSVSHSCPTVCNHMNCTMPILPVHYQLPESTQTHVHWVGDAIQTSHPLSSPSPPTFNLSQYQVNVIPIKIPMALFSKLKKKSWNLYRTTENSN